MRNIFTQPPWNCFKIELFFKHCTNEMLSRMLLHMIKSSLPVNSFIYNVTNIQRLFCNVNGLILFSNNLLNRNIIEKPMITWLKNVAVNLSFVNEQKISIYETFFYNIPVLHLQETELCLQELFHIFHVHLAFAHMLLLLRKTEIQKLMNSLSVILINLTSFKKESSWHLKTILKCS